MPANTERLIWIDLEMTGLNPDSDRIIEIATIVSNESLTDTVEGPVFAIHCGDDVLDAMDEWNTKHHGQSGLTERVRESAITLAQAERATIEFLSNWVPSNSSPMCGNSICQDRRFLYRGMPQLEAYFHYRNLDVSTIKELANRWRPDVSAAMKKQNTHRALDDIKESIEELRHYRAHFFKT